MRACLLSTNHKTDRAGLSNKKQLKGQHLIFVADGKMLKVPLNEKGRGGIYHFFSKQSISNQIFVILAIDTLSPTL